MSAKTFQIGDHVEVFHRDMSGYVLETDGDRYLVRIHALDVDWYPSRLLVFLSRKAPTTPVAPNLAQGGEL